MLDKKLKELEDKRKRIKKEKLEKKKRAERRKRREEKKKLDEKKALEKRKKLQARRQAIEDEKLAKQREIEKAEELARKEKEKKEKLEEKQKRKQQKETEKFLKERQKKHQKYLEIKERMEKEKRELFEKEILTNSEISDAVNVVKKEQKGKSTGKRVKKEETKISFLAIIFLIVCISVLAYSSYQIYIWVKSTQDLATIEEEVIEKVVKEVKDTSKEYSINIDFKELTEINSDVVGWIYIKNTDVNYPIMQAKDNDYYLKKNIYKQYSSCGSIFLDCDTDQFNEDNTVVYGHNLKNQKMFADLKKIYDGEFGKDVYIEVYDTENNFIKYKIFATYMVEPTLEVVKKDFKISEKKKYIDNAYNQSTVKFNCGFNYQKDLLTLVTCDNTGNKRIIVNALRVN